MEMETKDKRKEVKKVALDWARDMGSNISRAEELLTDMYGRKHYAHIDNRGRVKIIKSFKNIPWNRRDIQGYALVKLPNPEKTGRNVLKLAKIIKRCIVKKMGSMPLSFWARE